MILHSIAGSRSFRVLWLLEEMGITPEVRTYAITDGSMQAPEYVAKSPASRVPALEVDGLTLFESGAIVEYLCETRPEAGLGRLPGDPERADFLVWLHYSETVAVAVQNLNLQQLFLPDPAMKSPTVIGIEVRRLAKSLKVLEARLAEQDHMLASGFSAVDVMFGFAIKAAFRYVHKEKFPALQAYVARMAERPAYQKAQAEEGENLFYSKDFYEVPEG